MDKKSKKILMNYMNDTKRNLLSYEEIAYAKEQGAILENLPISSEEAISILTQSLKYISLIYLLFFSLLFVYDNQYILKFDKLNIS